MKKRPVKEKSAFHTAHKHNNYFVDFSIMIIMFLIMLLTMLMLMMTIDQRQAKKNSRTRPVYLKKMMTKNVMDQQMAEDFPHI